MKEIAYTSIIIITISLTGCVFKIKEDSGYIEERLSLLSPALLQADSIIIIPNEGCGGCIKNATSFIIDNIDSINMPVIFTRINDKKLLSIHLGTNLLSKTDKVYLDYNNHLSEVPEFSVYPTKICLTKQKINSITTFSP